MLFTSLQYLVFLPAVVLLFWLMPKKWRLPMLLVASYYFYASFIWQFLALILPMTLFNWVWGKVLHKDHSNKTLLGVGIAVNLLLLGFFKYTNFFADSIGSLMPLLGAANPHWSFNIILPLGISFFTFEFIHYLFEIYRGNKPIDNFVLFALFAAFFPTQIAGPIKRYPDFVAQMQADNKFELKYFDEGIPLIVIGLAKKLLLADNLAIFVQMGMEHPSFYSGPELWLFAYAFAFQIYFDFSGYTDVGRGSAMLFGYHIPINFNMPYIASNMADFWRRWHISLSTWLRDYLFIPLGGSRGGRWLTNRNLFLTMALGGLWHGASWNFAVWGVFHGLALIVHREFSQFKNGNLTLKNFLDIPAVAPVWGYLSMLLTFHAVCIGWVFFRIQDMGAATLMIKRMLTFRPFYSMPAPQHFVVMKQELPVVVPVVMVMVALLLLTNLPLSRINESGIFKKTPAPLQAVFCATLIVAMIVFQPDTSAPFIYFQF
ncbi:MAG: MBOAT family protein [Candidatus Obscuribacter sp.]|nr:MBOAT family protein [Candidatus Obscuribacter sp.]